jgi:predicted component of type VI protein secretion system
MAKALVLTGINGSKVGQAQLISGRTTVIGSGPVCQFILRDRMVQPRHAEIRQLLDRWFVVPLDPQAQVFVNGAVVKGQGRVNEGDTLTIGTATFKVGVTDVSEQAVGAVESTPSRNGVARLGDYLIKRGFVSRAQVQQAAQRQDELRVQGRRVQFGDVLYELGYISRAQLEVAVQEQRNDFYERFRD